MQAQVNSNKISGILNVGKTPLADAAVAAFNSVDSSIADGAISDEKGFFEIANLKKGDYYLRITAVGFADKFITNISLTDATPSKNLGFISISKSENNLRTVEIVNERPQFEMGIDKKIFNVEKNITATGGTAADVLQNVPSVSVDASGNVSLRGKGNVTILIDGRPATLLGSDVASALQAMPAASIQSIEVITNPSSKYDAQGNRGIINIVTKVNKSAGFNGTATLGIGTRGKYNGGLNLNLKKGKWNFALNSNFRITDKYQRTTTNRKNLLNDTGSYTFGDYQRKFNGIFNSATVTYDFDTNNKVSFTQNINFMRFGTEGGQEFDLFSAPGQNYSIQERAEIFDGGPNSLSSNLNWKHRFKKPKQEITTDITYSANSANVRQEINSTYLDGSRNLLGGGFFQESPATSSRSNINAQIDYSMPLGGSDGKLEVGAKTQNFWFETNNTPTITTAGNAPVEATFLLNHYEYYQQTHAGYASYSNKYKKWSYQAGMRVEYSGYKGTSFAPTLIEYRNEFTNPFPSAYLAYKISDEQQIYLNYSRRTDRPFFLKMLPYLNIANALDTSSGNPNLKPEFIDNYEFSYSYLHPKGHNIVASVYYQRTLNLMQNFTRIYADGTSFTQPVNLSSGTTLGAEITGKVQATKAWDIMLSANVFQNNLDGGNIDPSLNNNGLSWFNKLNTNYKLNKQISFQLMGNYESAKPLAQGRLNEVYWIDAAVKATFLKGNKASITLNVSDIFNTRKYTTNYNLPLYSQNIYRDVETRIGTINFSYNFGKSEFGNGGRGRGGRGKKGNNEIKKEAKERDGNIKSSDDDNNGG